MASSCLALALAAAWLALAAVLAATAAGLGGVLVVKPGLESAIVWRLSCEVLVPTEPSALFESSPLGSSGSVLRSLRLLPFPEPLGFSIMTMVQYGPGLVVPVVIYMVRGRSRPSLSILWSL
jgi:hypothetical protein